MTYFEGFVLPVPESRREEYRKHAAGAAPLFHEIGVQRHFEAWDSDVPEGKVTDFRKADWNAIVSPSGDQAGSVPVARSESHEPSRQCTCTLPEST